MSNIVNLRQKVEEKGVIPNKDGQLKVQKMELGEIPVLDFLKEYARRHEPTGTWAYVGKVKILTIPIVMSQQAPGPMIHLRD